jgi:predicted kinase
MICGKIAAGKSTLARRLADAPATILISEDVWLATLYRDEQRTVAEYARNARRLREVMGGHIEDLLRAGLSVVLDFPANTVANRQWMRGLFEKADAGHRLHVIDVPDAVCKARLLQRNAAGTHEFTVSDAEFDEITGYLVPPSADEGFETIVYRDAGSRS